MTPAPLLSHYHRVDTFLWYHVRSIMQGVVLDSLRLRPAPVVLCLDNSDLDGIVEFLLQMDTAYVHPRATSRRILLSPSRRGASPACSAFPLTNKNLSSNVQKNATIS